MPAMNGYSSSSTSYNFSGNILSSSLHSVRKVTSKPWKKPVPSQQLPPQIRVYCVESSSFRKVVQELTGAPKFQPNRLRQFAPPPINIIKPSPRQQFDNSSSQQVQLQQPLQLPLPQQQEPQQQLLETQYEEHHEIPLEVDYDIDFSSPEPLVKVNNENLFESNSPSVAAALTSIGLMSPTTWNTWCSAASSPLLSPGSMFALFGV